MSQKFLSTRVPGRTVRIWAGLFSGSVVLASTLNADGQEIRLPAGLPRVSTVSNHVRPIAPTLETYRRVNLGSDPLPAFPVDERMASATSAEYRPAALQPSRSGLIPTGYSRIATRQDQPSFVTALPPQRTTQDTVVSVPFQTTAIGQENEEWTLKPVDELKLAMYSKSTRPEKAAVATLNAAENGTQPSIANVGTVAAWVAPNLTYQPLLFEDARLERYGYASPYYGVQPIRSGVHFASSSVLFPWRAWFHRNECESPLAFERPGSWAPTMREVFVPALSSGWERP